MDHICGQLKAHAADSVNFRALVAEPRLGKVGHVSLFNNYFVLYFLGGLTESDSACCLISLLISTIFNSCSCIPY